MAKRTRVVGPGGPDGDLQQRATTALPRCSRPAGVGTEPRNRRVPVREGLAVTESVAAPTTPAAGSSASFGQGATTSSTTTLPVRNGDEALQRLLAGNERFVAGTPLHQGRDSARRTAVAEQQTPFAVILGCSDSRAIPEVLFDEGIGDLFVVRVAGNTATDASLLGSIEFAAAVLGSMLLMVLGHENCGAIEAAIEQVRHGTVAPGHVEAFVTPILPAVEAVADRPASELMNAAVQQNVRLQVRALSGSTPILGPLISEGRLKVVGAEYSLETGKVELVT